MPDTLYKRLGGYDTIVAVCDDLLPRLMGDAQLARFWQNRAEDSPDSLAVPDVWLRGDDQGSQVRRRLAAGGNRIRTFGSPTDPLPLREQSPPMTL